MLESTEAIMEEKLKEIFSYINHWLNFAEAKNGSIIAVNSAFIIGIASILANSDINIHNWLRLYMYTALVLLLLAIGLALWSFLPLVDRFTNCGNNDHDNSILIFFQDISKCKNAEEYVIRIYKDYYNSVKCENDISKLELDYAKEIIYNSKVTVRKYKCFKYALYCSIGAIISPLVALAFYLITKIYTNIDVI